MRKYVALIVSLTFSFGAIAQDDNQILATAGKYAITAKEFKLRWDLSPQPGRKQSSNLEPSKKELLQTIIAEKLLAQYAEKNGIDSLESIRQIMKSFEETYIKDKLYKVEIDSKVNVTPKMISEAKKRNATIMHVNYLFEADSVKAYHLYKLLGKGADFDSLLKMRPESKEQVKTISVSYGSMEIKAEDAIYSLKENEFSKPVKNYDGFFIFYLKWVEEKKADSGETVENQDKKIKDMVYIRELDKFYLEFMKTFFKGKKISSDSKIFYSLSEKIANKLSKYWADGLRGTTETKEIGLFDSDITELGNQFGPDTMKMPFIKFDDGFITLHDFLWNFQFGGFGVKTSDKKEIINKFAANVKLAGRDAAVVYEAYKRNYQNDASIRENLEMRLANLLSERAKGRVGSTIKLTEKDVKEYYDKKYRFLTDSVAVKLIEINLENMDLALKVLDRYNKGEAFSSLAKQYNDNEELKKTDGITQLFLPSQRGEIGKIAAESKLFDVKGPYASGKNYIIFQVIEKNKVGLVAKKEVEPFDEVKNELYNQLYQKKYDESLGKLIAAEAVQANLNINYPALEKVNVNSINMVAYQAMGFGGKILAVPYSAPTFSWVKYWQESKNQTP